MPRKKKEIEQAKEEKPKSRPVGRPTLYSKELSELVCRKIATNALSLKNLCKMFPELPSYETINEWRWDYPEFSDRYLAAKRMQAELNYDDCLEIADEGQNDYMESLSDDEKGMGYKLNGEHIQRSKLRIDTRMRLNARLTQNLDDDKDKKDGNSLIEKLAAKLNK